MKKRNTLRRKVSKRFKRKKRVSKRIKRNKSSKKRKLSGGGPIFPFALRQPTTEEYNERGKAEVARRKREKQRERERLDAAAAAAAAEASALLAAEDERERKAAAGEAPDSIWVWDVNWYNTLMEKSYGSLVDITSDFEKYVNTQRGYFEDDARATAAMRLAQEWRDYLDQDTYDPAQGWDVRASELASKSAREYGCPPQELEERIDRLPLEIRSIEKANAIISKRERGDWDKDYLASHLSVFGPLWKEGGFVHPRPRRQRR